MQRHRGKSACGGCRTRIRIVWLSLHYLRNNHKITPFLHHLHDPYMATGDFYKLLAEYSALYTLYVPYFHRTRYYW